MHWKDSKRSNEMMKNWKFKGVSTWGHNRKITENNTIQIRVTCLWKGLVELWKVLVELWKGQTTWRDSDFITEKKLIPKVGWFTERKWWWGGVYQTLYKIGIPSWIHFFKKLGHMKLSLYVSTLIDVQPWNVLKSEMNVSKKSQKSIHGGYTNWYRVGIPPPLIFFF